jgi:hypothetical protein
MKSSISLSISENHRACGKTYGKKITIHNKYKALQQQKKIHINGKVIWRGHDKRAPN